MTLSSPLEGPAATGLSPIHPAIEPRSLWQGNRFFLWYAPFLPHTPHNPPERLLAKYREPGRATAVAEYYAMVEWLDETVGQLCDYLDENGLAENTIVLYVADNGWLQAEDRTEQPMMRGKMSPYDSGVRSPIMVRLARQGRAGTG